MPTITTHKLLTGLWSSEVDGLEAAIAQLRSRGAEPDGCQVALFELLPGGALHVNVTHHRLTETADGWAGPGRLPNGFVHNRTFTSTHANRTVRQIVEMVAARAIS